MIYKKLSDLVESLVLAQDDLFLMSDVVGHESKKIKFSTLTQEFNTYDLNGRFQEGSGYTINKDSEGLVSSITTTFGAVTKTFSFARDVDSNVSSVTIHNSDSSYNKVYTFHRDGDGMVTSVSIS